MKKLNQIEIEDVKGGLSFGDVFDAVTDVTSFPAKVAASAVCAWGGADEPAKWLADSTVNGVKVLSGNK